MFTDEDRRLARMAAGRHGVFTRAHARAAGLKHGQIDHRAATAWCRIHEEVYRLGGAPPTWKGDLLAACWTAKPPAGISHRAAAQLYVLPGGEEVVELTTPRWLRARRRGVIVHESTRLHDSDLREIDGIPVMRPERVVFELAGLWPSPRYVERVVQAARRQRLITFESMSEEFARYARRGVRGVAAVRTVLEEWDPRARPTESEMETKLLRILRDAGFPDAVPQFEISDPRGRFVARVDLALPAARIAIEYDSKQEHSDEFQLARDAHRRNRITAAGWRVFSARHRDVVTGCAELLATIAAVRASA